MRPEFLVVGDAAVETGARMAVRRPPRKDALLKETRGRSYESLVCLATAQQRGVVWFSAARGFLFSRPGEELKTFPQKEKRLEKRLPQRVFSLCGKVFAFERNLENTRAMEGNRTKKRDVAAGGAR